MAKAATAGCRYVEPYVYSRVCLPINGHLVLESTTPYHHINVDEVEVGRLNRAARTWGSSSRRSTPIQHCSCRRSACLTESTEQKRRSP